MIMKVHLWRQPCGGINQNRKMDVALKQLKSDYKTAKASAKDRDEMKKVRHDYIEMKKLLKQINKILKDGERTRKNSKNISSPQK